MKRVRENDIGKGNNTGREDLVKRRKENRIKPIKEAKE